jgi:calcium-dependent protein kinase
MGNCFATKGVVKRTGILSSSQIQGKKELQHNYKLDSNTKILGSGAFGKVFLSSNKNKTDF